MSAVSDEIIDHCADAVMRLWHTEPDDGAAYDSAVDTVKAVLDALGLERAAWYQPRRQPGEQFWPAHWEPNEQWAQPVIPLFRIASQEEGQDKENPV